MKRVFSSANYFYLSMYTNILNFQLIFNFSMCYKFKRWVFSLRIINNWVLRTTQPNLQGQVLLRKRENSIRICHIFNLCIWTFQQIWDRLWTAQHWQKVFLTMISYYLAVYDHDQLLVHKFYMDRIWVKTEEWIWGWNVVCLKSQVSKSSVSASDNLSLTELLSGE